MENNIYYSLSPTGLSGMNGIGLIPGTDCTSCLVGKESEKWYWLNLETAGTGLKLLIFKGENWCSWLTGRGEIMAR